MCSLTEKMMTTLLTVVYRNFTEEAKCISNSQVTNFENVHTGHRIWSGKEDRDLHYIIDKLDRDLHYIMDKLFSCVYF